MKVSALAALSGVTPTTIRFYEAEGVLPAPPRASNGYREYSDVDVCRTRMIASLRRLGVELRESGRMAALCADGRCDEMSEQLLPRIREQRTAVAAERAELDHLDAELAHLEATLAAGQLTTGLCCGEEVS
jgi:DNA-binding transcriptional MerR regulator